MRSKSSFLTLAAFIALASLALPAEAHTKLVSSEPAANAEVASPKSITLHFSEGFETKFSSVELTDTDGTDVSTMPMESKDERALTVMPKATLPPGLYTVMWTTVAHDSHKMSGSYSFTVK